MAIARKIQLSSSSSSRSSSSTLPTFKSFASLMMTANNGSADSSPATSPPPTPAASIAALPSFTHSLSAFPTMTSVENDMVHYGTLGRSRDISKAKLNVVLEHTKQRRDARTHVDSARSPPASSWSQCDHSYTSYTQDDENALVISRRKHNKMHDKGPL